MRFLCCECERASPFGRLGWVGFAFGLVAHSVAILFSIRSLPSHFASFFLFVLSFLSKGGMMGRRLRLLGFPSSPLLLLHITLFPSHYSAHTLSFWRLLSLCKMSPNELLSSLIALTQFLLPSLNSFFLHSFPFSVIRSPLHRFPFLLFQMLFSHIFSFVDREMDGGGA